MASNSFGKNFRITTWGESHGTAIGVVIDGCPSQIPLSEDELTQKMQCRFVGRERKLCTERAERDRVQILSGLFEGKTTGAPLMLLIENKDYRSESYEKLKDIYRPGHPHYTYKAKYGVFDWRGSGRASARETACRVAAGAIAEKIVAASTIQVVSYVRACGSFTSQEPFSKEQGLSPLHCLSLADEAQIESIITQMKSEKDSIGGIVETVVLGVPAGLGSPVYEKLSSLFASAFMSIPGAKAFEIGEGVATSTMTGSQYNDIFYLENERVRTRTNHCGGILGGISTGEPLVFRTTFRPTPTIGKPQKGLTTEGEEVDFVFADIARHDPCITLRAVPVVSSMAYLVLADLLTSMPGSRFEDSRKAVKALFSNVRM